jgi:hypothetical protein
VCVFFVCAHKNKHTKNTHTKTHTQKTHTQKQTHKKHTHKNTHTKNTHTKTHTDHDIPFCAIFILSTNLLILIKSFYPGKMFH